MKALFVNCTLKKSPAVSNTEALAKILMQEMEKEGVTTEMLRLVDMTLKPGVRTDEGDGDEWPTVHRKMRTADIIVVATPTWLGHMSSIAQRMLERLDAAFSETDEQGRSWCLGKVAGVVITGNEDGAHHIVGTVSQGLIDLGFTVPGQSWTYWHLGPGPGPNYTETSQAHDYVDRVGRNAARNLVHAARALRKAGAFPEQES